MNEFSEHEVHLYESENRPGGHANTVPFSVQKDGQKLSVNVDTYVYNPTITFQLADTAD